MEYTDQDINAQAPLSSTMDIPEEEAVFALTSATVPGVTSSPIPRLSFIERITEAFDVIPAYFDTLFNRYQCPYCFANVHRRMKEYNIRTGHRKAVKLYRCANSSCRSELPSDFFASRTTSLAVVGGLQCGKTSFITLFCELLMHRKSLLGDLGIYGSIINQEGRDQFEKNRSILIQQELSLDGTTKDQHPTIVRLHNKHHKKVTYITLLDSPGEQFSKIDILIQKHPNLQYAQGIVFLMNPLDIGELLRLIQKERPGTIPSGSYTNNNNFDILETLYQFYLRTGRIKPNRKIKAHTAFCLSRADLIAEIVNLYIPPDFDPDMESIQDILSEVDLVSTDLRELLEETDKKLLNIMDKQYQNYRLFPVSPLGKMPRRDGMDLRVPGGVDPKGVLQPLIWLLQQTKFITEQ
ncbi:hypothetical protein [Chitinophaga sp. S165]|uniref:hypothetical protein n=1 Tax=Chitinophaga sp. S165 TaxID=2135462 RepID=UPI000D710DCF|nr:hypothetical protein [Chitinophaga sp. S165]PWV45826.1 hypothetical protein C7475_11243 [Chitinophaga sp. S165]